MWLDRTTCCRFIRGVSVAVVVVLVAGCTTEVMVRNAMNSAINRELEEGRARARVAIEQYLVRVDQLRKQGSPLAEYLWVVANADRWVPNPESDAVVLREMYLRAAAMGSVDAKYAIALMEYSGGTTPTRGNSSGAPNLPRPLRTDRAELIVVLDNLAKQRCWSFAPDFERGVCLIPQNIAQEVWPTYGGLRSDAPEFVAIKQRLRLLGEQCEREIRQLDRTGLATETGFPICAGSN